MTPKSKPHLLAVTHCGCVLKDALLATSLNTPFPWVWDAETSRTPKTWISFLSFWLPHSPLSCAVSSLWMKLRQSKTFKVGQVLRPRPLLNIFLYKLPDCYNAGQSHVNRALLTCWSLKSLLFHISSDQLQPSQHPVNGEWAFQTKTQLCYQEIVSLSPRTSKGGANNSQVES